MTHNTHLLERESPPLCPYRTRSLVSELFLQRFVFSNDRIFFFSFLFANYWFFTVPVFLAFFPPAQQRRATLFQLALLELINADPPLGNISNISNVGHFFRYHRQDCWTSVAREKEFQLIKGYLAFTALLRPVLTVPFRFYLWNFSLQSFRNYYLFFFIYPSFFFFFFVRLKCSKRCVKPVIPRRRNIHWKCSTRELQWIL